MKRYWGIVGGLILFFLLLFLLVEALDISILTDPSSVLHQGGPAAALIGVGLLVADILLPVPSSLVMIAHGALFGVAIGTLLSLIGTVGATMAGFAIGRRGGALFERMVPPAERERADRLLARWGTLAVIVTRPIPLLAETVAIMAGASPLGPGRVALAAVAGALPASLLYALTGAVAASFENGALMFGLVLLVAALFWFGGKRMERFVERPGEEGNGETVTERKAELDGDASRDAGS
jgi:uncharacterized membrane protein YdjX (TVP38/TMEM64 family)